ncbi:MAG: LysR family transcriptional regulator [Rhodoferax sp.]|nr:LysR family transcriptional regulator [Rhodoferax sp.]
MDTLANLKAFLAVARTGSFSAAARELGVAASVVTKRVGQVEWQLKSPLFERTTRRVSLTPTGRQYLPGVQRVIADLDGLMADARDTAPSLQGHIRVKLPTSIAVLHIGDLLHGFQRQYPLVSLEVMALDRAVNPVDEGFDLALTLMPHSYGGVVEEALCTIPRMICASPDYLARHGTPRHPRELAQHAILSFLPTGSTWEFNSGTGVVRVQLHPRLVSNEAQLLYAAALAGNGIAVLGAYLAAGAIADGRLQPLLVDYPMADLWMKALIPESRVQVERVQALLAWLRKALQPVPPWEAAHGVHPHAGTKPPRLARSPAKTKGDKT